MRHDLLPRELQLALFTLHGLAIRLKSAPNVPWQRKRTKKVRTPETTPTGFPDGSAR